MNELHSPSSKTLRINRAMREGAVHSNVRKAMAQGVSREEIEQVVAAAAGTIGMPATVAISTWGQDCFEKKKVPKNR